MSTSYAFVPTSYAVEESVVRSDPNVSQKDRTRYLFFPGNVIDPRRSRERSLDDPLRHGGDEIGSRSMTLTKGFLPRCFITPLRIGPELMTAELVPEGRDAFLGGERTQAAVQTFASALSGSPLVALKVYPGDEIAWIMHGSPNNSENRRKGIVELTPLERHFGNHSTGWKEFKASGIQDYFFPRKGAEVAKGVFLPKLPVTLREVEEQIRAKTRETGESLFVETGEQMLESCRQFREWGMAEVEEQNALLNIGTVPASGASGGHVYRYTGLADVLIEQLELPRQDEAQKRIADLNERILEVIAARGGQSDAAAIAEAVMRVMAEKESKKKRAPKEEE